MKKIDEMKKEAIQRVEENNPNCSDPKIDNVYTHIMDGTLISVAFKSSSGNQVLNHVYFGKETWTYQDYKEVLTEISGTKEGWLFRFVEVAGIGGLIAFLLILIFSVLLFVLIFYDKADTSIIDVVKLSFTTILGYFFGSHTSTKK